MESSNLIFILIAFLIGAVYFVVSLHKKEQNKAAEFHQASTYKYRANEAANILSNFSNFPIGEETRNILLQLINQNLINAKKILPNDQYINERLKVVGKQLSAPINKIDNKPISLSNDPQKLQSLLNNLTKLSKYIGSKKQIDQKSRQASISKLNLLTIEVKLTAYLQQVKHGIRIENFDFAEKRLVATQNTIANLKSANTRITSLQGELLQLEKLIQKGKVAQLHKKSNEQTKVIKSEDDENDLFTKKKKW